MLFLSHTSSRRRCVFVRTRSTSTDRYESMSDRRQDWCSSSDGRNRHEGSRSNRHTSAAACTAHSHETHSACNRTSIGVGPEPV